MLVPVSLPELTDLFIQQVRMKLLEYAGHKSRQREHSSKRKSLSSQRLILLKEADNKNGKYVNCIIWQVPREKKHRKGRKNKVSILGCAARKLALRKDLKKVRSKVKWKSEESVCCSLYKGPEAVTCLDYLKNRKEANIVEVEGVRSVKGGDTRAFMDLELGGACSLLACSRCVVNIHLIGSLIWKSGWKNEGYHFFRLQ